MKNRRQRIIGITLGDPAGIGAEIAVAACRSLSRRVRASLLLIGDRALLSPRENKRYPGFCRGDEFCAERSCPVSFLDVGFLDQTERIRYGKPSLRYGRAARAYIDAALDLIAGGTIDALVTGPVHKESIAAGGVAFLGHTEYLARRFRTRDYVMMLIGGPLRVALVTRHLPLAHVSREVTVARIMSTTAMVVRSLQEQFGIASPRVALCALNPHGGEHGLFGREEERVIVPAARLLHRRFPGVSGPYPADSLFHAAYRGAFDAIVCMYHDQGLIPLKMIAMERGVNVTLGLPFVRTSPDHGTAFDIAGTGRADHRSLREAILLAVRLSSGA